MSISVRFLFKEYIAHKKVTVYILIARLKYFLSLIMLQRFCNFSVESELQKFLNCSQPAHAVNNKTHQVENMRPVNCGWTISTAMQSIKCGETVFELASISQDMCLQHFVEIYTTPPTTYRTCLKINSFRQLVVQPTRSAMFSMIGSA